MTVGAFSMIFASILVIVVLPVGASSIRLSNYWYLHFSEQKGFKILQLCQGGERMTDNSKFLFGGCKGIGELQGQCGCMVTNESQGFQVKCATGGGAKNCPRRLTLRYGANLKFAEVVSESSTPKPKSTKLPQLNNASVTETSIVEDDYTFENETSDIIVGMAHTNSPKAMNYCHLYPILNMCLIFMPLYNIIVYYYVI